MSLPPYTESEFSSLFFSTLTVPSVYKAVRALVTQRRNKVASDMRFALMKNRQLYEQDRDPVTCTRTHDSEAVDEHGEKIDWVDMVWWGECLVDILQRIKSPMKTMRNPTTGSVSIAQVPQKWRRFYMVW